MREINEVEFEMVGGGTSCTTVVTQVGKFVGGYAGRTFGKAYGGEIGGSAGGYVGKQVGQAIGGMVCGDSWSLPSSSLRGDWTGFDAPDVSGAGGGRLPWAEYMCC